MAEEKQNNEDQTTQVEFGLQRCYIKDASIEMPGSPQMFATQFETQPEVGIQVEVSHVNVEKGVEEVSIRGTVTISVEKKTMTIVEVKQAGIFFVHGVPAEDMEEVCNVICPSMLFPYLRANIADLLTRTTMMPVHLPEMDFRVLNEQRLAQQKAAQDKTPGKA